MRQVLTVAEAWVGQEFEPGCREQCARFVRAVFARAGWILGVGGRPWDWDLTCDLEQGEDFANSFFSSEVGELITDFSRLMAGDLVGFHSTYQGNFPVGCITHVGIYIGEGQMIHRPTKDRPVQKESLSGYWKDHFCVAVRPYDIGS